MIFREKNRQPEAPEKAREYYISLCLNIMCSSGFPHQKSKTSRGESNTDMDKRVDKKKWRNFCRSKEGGLQPNKETQHIHY